MRLVALVLVVAAIVGCGGSDGPNAEATRTRELELTEIALLRAQATAEAIRQASATPPLPTATVSGVARPLPTSPPVTSPTPGSSPTRSPAVATPVPDPIVYEGSGDNVVELRKPSGIPEEPVVMFVRGNEAAALFAIVGYDAAGQQTNLFVNTNEYFEGLVPVDFGATETTTLLQVRATGPWFLELRPLASLRIIDIPGQTTGSGFDVFAVRGISRTAHVVGNAAAAQFAMIGYGQTVDLLVNTTGPYDGRIVVPAGLSVVEVIAVGEWTITFE